MIITDTMINIAPTIKDKIDICQNSIDLWQTLFAEKEGEKAKVALLAAIGYVDIDMPATTDAAILAKMGDRAQIEGAIIDGPLAFDNVISTNTIDENRISSSVAGDADILVVPNIESGNAIAKQLSLLGHADASGIVLGAKVPIILCSGKDSMRTRLLSCALALLVANHIKMKAL
jgi:phosphate acetyltransferase